MNDSVHGFVWLLTLAERAVWVRSLLLTSNRYEKNLQLS
jgi:hypothetical protein